VVRRVKVLSVPATWEVNLSTNTRWARTSRQLIVLRGNTVEVKAQESHGLLGKAVGIISAERGVTAEHAEIIRESSRSPGSIAEQVIDDGATVQTGETSIVPLEVKMREPVGRFILRDRN